MRHPNQKIPTFSIKRALETGQYDKAEYVYNQEIPQYILTYYKNNRRTQEHEM